MTDRYYDEKLLAEWAKGTKTRIPAPLSVRSRWYRRLIFQIAQTALLGPGGRILSIGAGTGKTECYLQSMGFDVIASMSMKQHFGSAAKLDWWCDISTSHLLLRRTF
jgi:hypothetical protein